jgi:predicted acyl esterase
LKVERDVAIVMRDGVRLFANVSRPDDGAPHPVVLSVNPYGKDKTPDRFGMLFMRLSGVKFGRLDCSRFTGFESPDPVFWVNEGYNVVQADVRGMNKSEGRAVNPQRARPGMPWHSHLRAEPVGPDEIVPVEIEILASSTLFEEGSTLRVDVLGHDADRYPAFKHQPTVNDGWHSIHAGATYDSHLLMPVVGRPDAQEPMKNHQPTNSKERMSE